MENIYENIPVLQKFKLNQEQMVLENNVTINGEDDAVKVLSASANVDVNTPNECLNKECNISGNVILNVVYVCEDGSLNNQVAKSPFSYKINNENIDINSKVNINATIVDTQIDKLQNNQIKVLTTLNIEGVVLKNTEMNYLKDVNDGTYIKQVEQDIVCLEKQNCDRITENLNATVKDGVKKVLMTNVDYVINDFNAGTNFVSVEGELYARILYANNQDPSELQTVTITKAFKQEVETDGINKDSDCEVFAHIIHENVQVELTEKENNETDIDVTIPILICNNVYTCTKTMTVQDIYSCKNVLAVTQGECENYTNLPPEILDGKIEGDVVLTENDPRIDKYLATTNVCNIISNCYINDDVLNIEGVVSANVVYLNDELGALQSVQIEIPYVLNKKCDLPNDVILQPIVTLCDVDVMVKRGREIYFTAKAKAYVNVTQKNNVCMVTKVEDIGALPERDSALEIYFAKTGQTFWDIAKNLKIPAETIATQNPTLTDPLEKDENIAIYYQKKA